MWEKFIKCFPCFAYMRKQIDYLRKMTDDFGIVQFSDGNNPEIKSGYTIDDVSRALIVSSKLNLKGLSDIYFNFIKNAQTKDGRFVNVYSSSREPLEEYGSEDSYGRTLWALGEYMAKTGRGKELSHLALNALEEFGLHYPVSESFAILGLTKMHNSDYDKNRTGKLIRKLSSSLIDRLKNNRDRNWFWVSDEMSYENARIPQALLRAFSSTGDYNFLKYSNILCSFLDRTVFESDEKGNSLLNVVGNSTSGLEGKWYKKGSVKPRFDEQPVDAGGMVELHSEAYAIKENIDDFAKAKTSFDWFGGKNRLGRRMISGNGGVYDGLNENSVNSNQGAESLLAYMMAKIKFDEIEGKSLYNQDREMVNREK